MVINLEEIQLDLEDIIGEEEIVMTQTPTSTREEKILMTQMEKITIAMVFQEKILKELLIKIYTAKIVDKLVLPLLVIVPELTLKYQQNI